MYRAFSCLQPIDDNIEKSGKQSFSSAVAEVEKQASFNKKSRGDSKVSKPKQIQRFDSYDNVL